ncbi:hypothetical protein BDN70DRAFT_615073 [Pholiota conissans]|uniref:Uncharacterized protein n=1 Tax=Pholiota conissans TaxID=109636 RepID=A0A9P5YM08_9AGAR|nr:hypothetical protein BDN70DRAFT_615073 [Pholiota conissans]
MCSDTGLSVSEFDAASLLKHSYFHPMLPPPPGLSCQAHRQIIYRLTHVVSSTRIRSPLRLDTSTSFAAFDRSPSFSAPFMTIHPPSTTSSFSHGSIHITHFPHSGLVNCDAFRQTNALPVNSARRQR